MVQKKKYHYQTLKNLNLCNYLVIIFIININGVPNVELTYVKWLATLLEFQEQENLELLTLF